MSESQNSYAEAGQRRSAHRMIPCTEKNHPCSDRKPNSGHLRLGLGGSGRDRLSRDMRLFRGIQCIVVVFSQVYIYVKLQIHVCAVYCMSIKPQDAVTNTRIHHSTYSTMYTLFLSFFFIWLHQVLLAA